MSFIKRTKLSAVIISTLFTALFTTLQAQPNTKKGNFKELFTQANLMMSENFVDSALKTFITMYPMDTSDANVCYYIGQLYLLTEAHKQEALPYLEKAAKHIAQKYHPDDPYEKDAPPPTYYFLARAQHLNYMFDDAIGNFSKFKDLLNKDDSRQKDIDYWISCCNNGKELMKTPVDCKIINLGDSVNSEFPEYSPVLSADEQQLMFTRRGSKNDTNKDKNGNFYETMWMSSLKQDKTWTTAQPMSFGMFTSGGNQATVSLSSDGQQLVIYQDDDKGNGDLYVSYLKGVTWTYPVYIDSNTNHGVVNSPSWEPSACMSPDQKTLYFVSNRAGGLGGTDIYKVDVSNSDKWGQPVNLGPSVNSAYDEDAPFMHPDDSTLFFSSKGHNTMGGYDIFMSQQSASGQWSNAQNMGYPINTPDDDIYFSVSPDGRRGYYTSVQKDSRGEKDLYQVIFKKPLPVQQVAILVGYLKTQDGSHLPNDLKVTIGPVGGSNTVTTSVNYVTGKFLQIMRPNQNYNVSVSTQGKNVFNHSFYLPVDSSYLSLSRAFFRTAIILGDTTNVFVPRRKLTTPVTTTPAVASASMNGKLLLNDNPIEPLSAVAVQLVDDNGKVIQTAVTNSDGSFTFGNLAIDHNYTLVVDTKDTKLRKLKKLLLANSKGEVIRSFDMNKKKSYYYNNLPVDLNSLKGTQPVSNKQVAANNNSNKNNNNQTTSSSDAAFTRYFGYNVDDVSSKDDGFNSLIDKLVSQLASGTVSLNIKGSASTVPTRFLHSSNKNLASRRAKRAKQAIISALKNKNADISKLSIEVSASVQGPAYEHDGRTDESKYQQFQYVKVYIR